MDFEELIIDKFKKLYKIDISKARELEIKGMLFPNYFTNSVLDLEFERDYRSFEFCRIINKIFGFGELSYYEIPEVRLSEHDVVFDCGANTGIFSLYAAYKVSKVLAFEPSTLIRHYLKNTQNYNFKICSVPYGVSDINKEEWFNQADNPGAARTEDIEMPEYHKILYKEKVKLVSLDSFVEKTSVIPTFIKMDIEGGEKDAIKGSVNILQKYKPKCSISIHPENGNNIEYIKSLFPAGYEFYIKEEKFYDPLLLCWYKGE